MHKLRGLVLALVILTLVSVCIVDATPQIQTNKQTLVRDSNGGTNSFVVIYLGDPATTYDVLINNGDVSGVTSPVLAQTQRNEINLVSSGHYRVVTNDKGFAYIKFDTSIETTPLTYTFSINGANINVTVLDSVPTIEPTPIPTPTYGNLVIDSTPSGAMVFLNKEIKGITPLTINALPNGKYEIDLKLEGHKDGKTKVTIDGNNEVVYLELSPIETPKPTPTEDYSAKIEVVETRIAEHETTLTEHEIAIATLSVTHELTPVPTATIDHMATIARLEEEIAVMEAKNQEQDDFIHQILVYLGLIQD